MASFDSNRSEYSARLFSEISSEEVCAFIRLENTLDFFKNIILLKTVCSFYWFISAKIEVYHT